MPLQLDLCDDGDMPRAFTILSQAFAHEHPYFDYVFPKHDTPNGRKVGGERILAFKKGDPNTTFVKATDTETGIIVGVAKWNVYKGVVPDEIDMEGDYWDSEQDKKLAQEMWAGYLMPRRRAIKDTNGNLVSLDMMSIHPDYQRKGVGHMLTRWGTAIADEKGVLAVVEATPQGRGLYASEGFQVEIGHYTVQLSNEFKARPTQSFTWMLRPAKTKV